MNMTKEQRAELTQVKRRIQQHRREQDRALATCERQIKKLGP